MPRPRYRPHAADPGWHEDRRHDEWEDQHHQGTSTGPYPTPAGEAQRDRDDQRQQFLARNEAGRCHGNIASAQTGMPRSGDDRQMGTQPLPAQAQAEERQRQRDSACRSRPVGQCAKPEHQHAAGAGEGVFGANRPMCRPAPPPMLGAVGAVAATGSGAAHAAWGGGTPQDALGSLLRKASASHIDCPHARFRAIIAPCSKR